MTLRDDIARYANSRGIEHMYGGSRLAADIAAGLERDKVIIDRADLPEVTVYGPDYVECDNETIYYGDPEKLRRDARRSLALAGHFEARNNEAATLEARRDKLAQKFAPRYGELKANWYGNVSAGLQRAIDHIISNEDQATA